MIQGTDEESDEEVTQGKAGKVQSFCPHGTEVCHSPVCGHVHQPRNSTNPVRMEVLRRLDHKGMIKNYLHFRPPPPLSIQWAVALKILTFQSWMSRPIQEPVKSNHIKTRKHCYLPGNFKRFKSCVSGTPGSRTNIRIKDAPSALMTQEIIRFLGPLPQELMAEFQKKRFSYHLYL